MLAAATAAEAQERLDADLAQLVQELGLRRPKLDQTILDAMETLAAAAGIALEQIRAIFGGRFYV